MRLTTQQRFDLKVKLVGASGCLVRSGAPDPDGYGRFNIDGIPMLAHRVAWMLAGNELPKWPLVLDHTCRNRWCVNVDHLEVVTHLENRVRGTRQQNKTTCRNGLHPWPESRVVSGGKPRCKPCHDAHRR
jgi:hypothetical protein